MSSRNGVTLTLGTLTYRPCVTEATADARVAQCILTRGDREKRTMVCAHVRVAVTQHVSYAVNAVRIALVRAHDG